MSLLWLDSFENYGTTVDSAPAPTGIMGSKYDSVTGESDFRVVNGRSGYGIKLPLGTRYFDLSGRTTNATMIFGCACKFSKVVVGNTSTYFLYLREGNIGSLGLNIYQGEIAVVRGGITVLGMTQGLALSPDIWYWIELKALWGQAGVGSYEVRVGGVNVLSASGVDTAQSTQGYYDGVRIRTCFSFDVSFDSVYLCDGAGSANNDFLGNVTVKAIRPDGDDTTNFATASPSANHYENVDEALSDENTSYNQDPTSGQRELYDHGSVSGLNTIKGVMLNARLRTNSGVSENFQHLTKSSSTEDNSANVSTSTTSFETFTRILEQDPNASAAWTSSTVNAAKFGIELP